MSYGPGACYRSFVEVWIAQDCFHGGVAAEGVTDHAQAAEVHERTLGRQRADHPDMILQGEFLHIVVDVVLKGFGAKGRAAPIHDYGHEAQLRKALSAARHPVRHAAFKIVRRRHDLRAVIYAFDDGIAMRCIEPMRFEKNAVQLAAIARRSVDGFRCDPSCRPCRFDVGLLQWHDDSTVNLSQNCYWRLIDIGPRVDEVASRGRNHLRRRIG